MGESDRLLTILTREQGLVRVLAMGARKHRSSLAGRSGLFVVNHLLIAQGKSLDKLTQAETIASYPGLSRDLKKLTASQYLAELCLYQALSEQPQAELFDQFIRHLDWIERSPPDWVLPYLVYAIFQLLMLDGVAPEVYRCCVTQAPLLPQLEVPDWQVGFSAPVGGTVTLEAMQRLATVPQAPVERSRTGLGTRGTRWQRSISAMELAILQAIAQLDSHAILTEPDGLGVVQMMATLEEWLTVESLLRQCAQYHFDRPIRSATLMDTCFALAPDSPHLERF